MSSIMSFIEGYMTGNAWEELCVQCYHIRYQKDNYTYIPAAQGGDAGIEGFTNKGIVHQCYCPERVYSDDDLYEHQRDKLTTDIEKLKKTPIGLAHLVSLPWLNGIIIFQSIKILELLHMRKQNDKRF